MGQPRLPLVQLESQAGRRWCVALFGVKMALAQVICHIALICARTTRARQ